MASVSETGHAKNVANLQDLISFVTGYGATYNPTKNALKLPQLTALATASQTSLADVITKNTAYNNKVNERVNAFSGLKALSTRLVNALETTDATAQVIKMQKVLIASYKANEHQQLQRLSTQTHQHQQPFLQVSNRMTNKYNIWQV